MKKITKKIRWIKIADCWYISDDPIFKIFGHDYLEKKKKGI